MTTTNPDTVDRWTLIKHYWQHEYTWLWLLPGLFFGLIIGFVIGWLAQGGISVQELRNLVTNFVPEAIGIGLAVTVLYFYEQRRDERKDTKRLMEELPRQAKVAPMTLRWQLLRKCRLDNGYRVTSNCSEEYGHQRQTGSAPI